MNRNLTFAVIAAVALIGGISTAPTLRADPPSPAEAKLRDALKNTMLQLRTAQTDLATAQAAQAESDQKVATLTAQVDELTRQSAADKDASGKAIAALSAKNTSQAALITRYEATFPIYVDDLKKAVVAFKAKEAERAKLAEEKIMLQRRVDDLETKNAELYKTGSDILTRYEKFSLGEAIAAKEPFVGTTRVKLENLVQDLQDKLADQKSAPVPATPGTPNQKNTPASAQPK